MRDIEKRQRYREELIEHIAKSAPRYALTLTFEANSFEKYTRKALNSLIVRLNGSIYKKRYENGLSDLKGYCTRERGKLLRKNTEGLMYCDHYHLIIFEGDGYLPDRDSFRRKVLKEMGYLGRDKSLAEFRTFDLQDYYNWGSDDLESYNTKIFDQWFLDDDYVMDSIGPIDRDRVLLGRDVFESQW